MIESIFQQQQLALESVAVSQRKAEHVVLEAIKRVLRLTRMAGIRKPMVTAYLSPIEDNSIQIISGIIH